MSQSFFLSFVLEVSTWPLKLHSILFLVVHQIFQWSICRIFLWIVFAVLRNQSRQEWSSINLPRRSFLHPERFVRLDRVHPFVFAESFGKKFGAEERRHTPPTDKLLYEVHDLSKCLEIKTGNLYAVMQLAT